MIRIVTANVCHTYACTTRKQITQRIRNEEKEADENESSSTHARPIRNACRPDTLYTTVRACVKKYIVQKI